MKATVTVIASIDEQVQDGDNFVIDPATVRPKSVVPVIGPGGEIGVVTGFHLVDGRLLADVEILNSKTPFEFHPGGTVGSDGFHIDRLELYLKDVMP